MEQEITNDIDIEESISKETQIAEEHKISNAFKSPYPYITLLVTLVCVSIWIGIQFEGEITDWDQYNKWGFYSYQNILSGNLQGLITSNFVHEDFIHILFNLSWILTLGTKIEREIGRLKYLFLLLSSCLVSSGIQLLFSDTTGIGISGVVYSFIGFIWICGFSKDEFRNFLTKSDFNYAVIWLVGCWIFTYLELASIGNYAHLAGLVWGISFAYAYILKQKRSFNIVAQLLMIFFSILPAFYAPWSFEWLSHQTFQSVYNTDNEKAISYADKALAIKPNDGGLNSIRGLISEEKNDDKSAEEFYRKAIQAETKTYIAFDGLSRILIKQNKLTEARDIILKGIQDKTDDNRLYTLLGIVYLRLQNFDEAISAYQKVIDSGDKDNNANAYYNIACSYSLKGNEDQAITNLKKSIEIDKKFIKLAIKDKDFESLKNSKEFKELVH